MKMTKDYIDLLVALLKQDKEYIETTKNIVCPEIDIAIDVLKAQVIKNDYMWKGFEK